MNKEQNFLKLIIFLTFSLQKDIVRVLVFFVFVFGQGKIFLQIRLGKEGPLSFTNRHKHSSQKIKPSPALKALSEYLLTEMGLIYTLLINPISWVISFPFDW